jgi:uncharacterized protein (DUF1778 family)
MYACCAYTVCMAATKDARLHARLSAEQDALIRRAADVEGKSITDFTVEAAVDHAKDVLTDRRLFLLDDAAWTEFITLLDRPVVAKDRLADLFSEETIFE